MIIAPDASDEAIAIVAAKKNLRLLVAGGLPDPRAPGLVAAHRRGRLPGAGARQRGRRRDGAQGRDAARADERASSPICSFAFRVAKHVKSNAIVYARDGRDGRHRRGPDAPGRFIAHRRLEGGRGGEERRPAESLAKGSVVASDAFFPFADGLSPRRKRARRR